MKKLPVFLILSILLLSEPVLFSETGTSVTAEFFNTFITVSDPGDWRYTQSGSAGLVFRNLESRTVRGELSLDFSGASGVNGDLPLISLKKFYIRPGFGDVLMSLGKTRSSWGSGLAFNAGDLIFGSDSSDFDPGSSDPRPETAWLVNAEVPLGDFSFLEFIALPGNTQGAELPDADQASAGMRVHFDTGSLILQAGYLYRGDSIAGLGSPGQRAFISLEGFSPLKWCLSTSAATAVDHFSAEDIRDSWSVTGGLFQDLALGYRGTLAWRLEFLYRPFGSLSTDDSDGLLLYPVITWSSGGSSSLTLGSLISPMDLSASSSLLFSWNVYGELSLQAAVLIQTGDTNDLFSPENPGGLGLTLGAKYIY